MRLFRKPDLLDDGYLVRMEVLMGKNGPLCLGRPLYDAGGREGVSGEISSSRAFTLGKSGRSLCPTGGHHVLEFVILSQPVTRHLSPINITASPLVQAEARIHPPATFSALFASLALIWIRAERIATPESR